MGIESPNYAEYSYTEKSEGVVLLKRIFMVVFYVLYLVGFFIFATTSGFIALFAIGPLTLYIIVLCTWRLVSFDLYVEFEKGMLHLGRIKVGKGGRRKIPKLSIHVKEALDISEYRDRSQLVGVTKIYDYSASLRSDKRIYIIFEENGIKSAAIFESTARIANLLASFCPNARDVKGKPFHG